MSVCQRGRVQCDCYCCQDFYKQMGKLHVHTQANSETMLGQWRLNTVPAVLTCVHMQVHTPTMKPIDGLRGITVAIRVDILSSQNRLLFLKVFKGHFSWTETSPLLNYNYCNDKADIVHIVILLKEDTIILNVIVDQFKTSVPLSTFGTCWAGDICYLHTSLQLC